MDKVQIRLLRADEIECRVGIINEKGLSLLLFKDARVDQKILDEVFTPFGWKRTHQEIGGNLYCTVDIWDSEKQQWISKQDVGTMSYTEKEKGQASDSFKRACFNVGIGRELYTAPFIWIPAAKVKIQMRSDKYYTVEKFSVMEIGCSENREINRLKICNERRTVVFSMGKEAAEPQREIRELLDNRARETLMKELERTGVALEAVLKRYRISSLNDVTPEIYKKALNSLKNTKTKEAA